MVGITLILFEGLPLLSLVRVAVGRTKIACGIAKVAGIVGVGEASVTDGMVGAIGMVVALIQLGLVSIHLKSWFLCHPSKLP